jgi:MFS family permease
VVAAGVSSIALPWIVLENGGTSTEAGLIFALSIFPYVVFGLPAGVIGDRHKRRTVMWVAHATQIAAALIIPFWAFAGPPPLFIILIAAFAIGTARVFVDAAVFGAIAAIVGRERFTQGQATLSAAWAIGFFAGPAIGGILIGLIGPSFTLVAEAVGFAVAMVMILLIRKPLDAQVRALHEPAWAMMKEGLAVIWQTPRVRAYTWLSIGWNLGAAASAALIVPLLHVTLGLDSLRAGIVLAIGAAVGVGVPSLLGRLIPRFGAGRVVAWTTALSGLTVLATGLAPGFASVAAANSLRQLSDYSLLSTIIGERQRGVPDRLQARVGISGRMIAVAAISSGAAIGALLADVVGVRWVFVISAVAVAIAFAITIPGILRLEREADR